MQNVRVYLSKTAWTWRLTSFGVLLNQPVARNVVPQVANGFRLIGPSFVSILRATSTTSALAQGHYLAPCVPVVLVPMSVGAVSAGVWIFKNFSPSKDTGCLSRREGEEQCVASLRLSLSPDREKLSTPGAHRQQDARRDCSISPTGRHFGRRTTVPPFEWQTKEAICGRPSSLTYEVCPGRHFLLLFGGGVSCVPSYGRQYNVDIYI